MKEVENSMLFVPYPDESRIINMIHKIRNEDYAVIRLTFTMIDKNNLDANGLFRALLLKMGIVDYESLPFGGKNGITTTALFVQTGKVDKIKLNFYRVSNSRGDRRFSIETLKRKKDEHAIEEGDLLYFSVIRKPDGLSQIFIVNLTRNTPTEQELTSALGIDAISQMFANIKPTLKTIVNGGFYDNSKGQGCMAPKDVGDTLEKLLNIETNNRNDADFEGLIEIKSKGSKATLDTLFTLRPCFENTEIAEYEPNDKQRVSAFARYYGYDSDKHPGYSSLYITIGSSDAPQNGQGFFLDVDEDAEKVYLKRINPETEKVKVSAYWLFKDLKDQLYKKHPSTLWFKAESRVVGSMVQFKYHEIEFSRSPQFTTFLTLIKAGVVTYDWRGYTTKTGKYSGKNHGNAWRIKPKAKNQLFGEIERIVI